jgi:hypothetical protein
MLERGATLLGGVYGFFQNTQPPPLFPSMSFASSSFQNSENVVKLKISQAFFPGAPELIEEVDDEIAEVEATNGQLEDEMKNISNLIKNSK